MNLKGRKSFAIPGILVLVAMFPIVVWGNEEVLQQRIERLERIVQGQGLISLLARVDQLQNDVKKLSGDNESLEHKIEKMQQLQHDLYIDFDERLRAQAQSKKIQTSDVAKSVQDKQAMSERETPLALTPIATITDTSPVAVENGEAAYQAALQILRSGQYEKAVAALAIFPKQYPQSKYVPNAYYWLGEANYVLNNFEQAINAFQMVMDHFPASSKVADSMLKKGFSQYELNQVDVAKITLTTVLQQYPNTSASRLAKVRLDRIKQQPSN